MEWLPAIAAMVPVLVTITAAWWQLGTRLTKLETQMDLLLRGLRISVTPREES